MAVRQETWLVSGKDFDILIDQKVVAIMSSLLSPPPTRASTTSIVACRSRRHGHKSFVFGLLPERTCTIKQTILASHWLVWDANKIRPFGDHSIAVRCS